MFGEPLPKGDGERKQHCRKMKAWWVTNRKLMEGRLKEDERELEAAEGELGRARGQLRRIRCAIMENAVPPPEYQKRA